MNSYQKTAFIYYVNCFIPAENKLAILSIERKYKRLEGILKELIYIFDKTNFNGQKLNSLICLIFDYQQDYFRELERLGLVKDEYSKKYKKLLSKSKIEDKSKALYFLLQEIDCTQVSILKNIDKNEDGEVNISKIEPYFKYYYQAYKKYETIINKIKLEQSSTQLHSANSFINEFHQFFTHLSYSQLAIEKQIKDNHSDFNNFIKTNYDRGIKHIQRATLDIYKVIIVILNKNKKLTSANKLDLIQIRQFEINNISLAFTEKIKRYKKFVNSIKIIHT